MREAEEVLRGQLGARAALAIFVVAALYLQSYAAYGFNVRDEGVIPNGALRVLGGQVPWKDFQGYAPGPYYLHAAAFLLFGPNLQVARTLIVLMSALMVVMIVQVGARIMPWPAALLAGALLLLAPGVYYARYINFFTLLNILAFFRALRGPGGVFLLGLVGGLTVLFRQDLGLAVLGVGGVCLLLAGPSHTRPHGGSRAASLGLLSTGAALVLVPWVLYYYAHSVLGEILRLHLNASAGGYQKMSLPYPRPLELAAEGRWGELAVFYAPPLVFAGMGGLLLWRFWRRAFASPEVVLTYITFVALLMFHQAIWRTAVENHVKVIAPILLLGAFLISRGASELWSLWRGRRRSWLAGAACIVGWGLLTAGPALYAWEMLSRHGFTVGAISVLKSPSKEFRLGPAHAYMQPELVDATVALVQYIQAHTSRWEPVYVLPFAPMLYFLTDRPNPSFFEWVLPAEPLIYPDLERRIRTDLDRSRPAYLVFEDFPLDGKEDRRFRNYASGVYRYLTDHFAIVARFGDFQVWRRIGATSR